MAKTAAAVSRARADEDTITHVDELIQRGRGQGYLSLPELRDAFDKARVSPAEARSIIREMTEAGVQLANEPSDAVDPASLPADLDAELAAMTETDAAAVAGALAARGSVDTSTAPESDLDDQTSVMGDSVHTYLKSIGRRQLLTAEEEVQLAKRIEAGLYAEHKLETEKRLAKKYRAELEAVA
ncbi:MAG: RNA polymerase sigma factor, partial [Actinobacteria bacterium]|nr:RNA polymerase sigma factor [Actinomycetota bacterium]MBO0835742.1 RNA polymerase sigma factor [Actinomycetota bacterium]